MIGRVFLYDGTKKLPESKYVMGQPDQSLSLEEIRCENVTDEIIASYAEQGYRLAFVEEVMSCDLSHPLSHPVLPFDVSYFTWTSERAHDFFTVYAAAFRERPGFPGWSEAEWVQWTSDDPDFRPNLSFLAVVQGQTVGFITNAEEMNAQHGFIIQVGVHPQWRGQGLGAALISRSLQAWKEAGKKSVLLDVNVNNPGALHLYQQLGFVVVRRRAKFTRRIP